MSYYSSIGLVLEIREGKELSKEEITSISKTLDTFFSIVRFREDQVACYENSVNHFETTEDYFKDINQLLEQIDKKNHPVFKGAQLIELGEDKYSNEITYGNYSYIEPFYIDAHLNHPMFDLSTSMFKTTYDDEDILITSNLGKDETIKLINRAKEQGVPLVGEQFDKGLNWFLFKNVPSGYDVHWNKIEELE